MANSVSRAAPGSRGTAGDWLVDQLQEVTDTVGVMLIRVASSSL
jgi:hypothetical protein